MSTRHWDQPSQNAPGLDAGEGDHKNPAPVFFQRDVTSEDEKAKGKKTIEYFAEEWDLLDFPINMAKPRVMEATTRNDAKTLRRFSGLARLSPKAGSANCRAHQRSRSPGLGRTALRELHHCLVARHCQPLTFDRKNENEND